MDTHAAPPPLHLRHALLWRIGGAMLLALLLLAWRDWSDWHTRMRAELPASGALVAKLVNDDQARRSQSFDRVNLSVDLTTLHILTHQAPLCVAVSDLQDKPLADSCQPADRTGLAAGFARRLAPGVTAVTQDLTVPPSVKVGDIRVEPHWTLEGQALARRWALLGAAGFGLALALTFGARLITRALAPANQVLAALARLAGGDLQVRLPPLALQELRHIGEGFNRVAASWSAARREQQRLTARLLQSREEERRRLARELHDEMGQSLAALQAEAAAMGQLARDTLPQAAAGAQAMARTTSQLLDGLQRILADLRPQALDRFGLAAALRALVDAPRQRADGSTLRTTLVLPEPLPPLPADHDVHVYRIVQEALTNALRHGDARHAEVVLACTADTLELTVADDGRGRPGALPIAPGHGLLGLHERVAALDGRLECTPTARGGLLLRVGLPLATAAEAAS